LIRIIHNVNVFLNQDAHLSLICFYRFCDVDNLVIASRQKGFLVVEVEPYFYDLLNELGEVINFVVFREITILLDRRALLQDKLALLVELLRYYIA